MKVLVMNCSLVRNGATAERVKIGGKIDSKRLTDLEGEYVMAKTINIKKQP